MELRGNWNYPTAIRFGAGRIKELPDACKTLGMRRPLLVTDPGLAALPLIGQATDLCREAGLDCAVYSDVQPNPVEDNVTGGVDKTVSVCVIGPSTASTTTRAPSTARKLLVTAPLKSM